MRGMAESLHMCSAPAVVAVFGQSKILTAITVLDRNHSSGHGVYIAIYESGHHNH